MIQLRIGTASGRVTDMVARTETPMQTLERQDVILDGAVISLDGIPLSYQDLNTSYEALGARDTATLSVTVKTGNA